MIDQIIECAREAGRLAMTHFRSGHDLKRHNKLNDSDIVTIADAECEAYIKNFIATRFPGHAILSEESGESEGVPGTGYRWVIDPIDGTTNFFSGLPIWAISIGLELDGEAVAGVVYAPATGELFHAVRGEGAYLNGQPIKVSAETALARSVACTGFPVDKNVNPDNNLDNLARVLPLVRDVRRFCAASVDICYVAAGFLQAYWEMNLHEWDVCAATFILQEAGGVCSRFRQGRGVSVLCAPEAIHSLLTPLIK